MFFGKGPEPFPKNRLKSKTPVTIDVISDRIGLFMDIMVYTVDKITDILMILLVYLTYYTHSDRMTGKGSFITIYFIYPIM